MSINGHRVTAGPPSDDEDNDEDVQTAVSTIEFQISAAPLVKIEVMVVNDSAGCCLEVKELIRRMKNSNTTHLGMDCEWKPGGKFPVALLQLATDGFCLLIRLMNMHRIPRALKELLEDRSLIKAGTEIRKDAGKLEQLFDHSLDVKGCIDLKYLVNIKELRVELNKPTPSLEDIARYAKVPFKKDKSQTFSNWESERLDPDQLMYAAQDAAVGAKIFFNLSLIVPNWIQYLDKNYSGKDRVKDKPQLQAEQKSLCDMCGKIQTGSKHFHKAKVAPVELEKLMPALLHSWETDIVQLCGTCQQSWHKEQRNTQTDLDNQCAEADRNNNRKKHAKAVIALYIEEGLIQLVRLFLERFFHTAQQRRPVPLPKDWSQTWGDRHSEKIRGKLDEMALTDDVGSGAIYEQIFGSGAIYEQPSPPHRFSRLPHVGEEMPGRQ